MKRFSLYLLVTIFFALMFFGAKKYLYPTIKSELIKFIAKSNTISNLPKQAVLVYPIGGIGNQMFQYSAAYSFAKKFNRPLYVIVDKQHLNKTNKVPSDRVFELNIFNIAKDKIILKQNINQYFLDIHQKVSYSSHKNPDEIKAYTEKIKKDYNIEYVQEDQFYHYTSLDPNKTYFINDYFEAGDLYFKDYQAEIKNIFKFPKSFSKKFDQLNSKLHKKNSVCMHVRRGDLLNQAIYSTYIKPIKYQEKAIDLVKRLISSPNFFIFTDSPEVVKDELKNQNSSRFIEDNLAIEDMYLMSECHNLIITTSTFSWWSGYLNSNNDKLVVAPKERLTRSFFQEAYQENDNSRYFKQALLQNHHYPEDWLLFNENSLDLPFFVNRVFFGETKKINDLLSNYKPQEFELSDGKNVQLELCEHGDFKTNLCYSYKKLINNKITIVTAIYNVKSFSSFDKYKEWVKIFLGIPFDLVVFTAKENFAWIKELRGDKPIILIEKEISQFEHYKFLNYYKQFNLSDPLSEKRSPELYMLWSEKVKFVNQAINLNPYKSNFFMWMDVEIFRLLPKNIKIDQRFPNIKFSTNNKMTFFMVYDFIKEHYNKNYVDHDHCVLMSGLQLGDIKAWKIYNRLWDNIIQDFLNQNLNFRNEQTVMASLALKFPNFFNLRFADIFNNKEETNKWYYPVIYYNQFDQLKE